MYWIWSVSVFLTTNTVFTRMAHRGQTIYPPLDDGPQPDHTPPLLALLKAHRVKATFFFIGFLAQRYLDIVQRIVDEGHAIGNHSMTHPRMSRLSARAQNADIDAADGVLQRFNGRRQQLFRPPSGRATAVTILDSVLRQRSLVSWTVDSKDCKLDAEQVVARMSQAALRGGAILLFHDNGGAAGATLARLRPHWQGADLLFATL